MSFIRKVVAVVFIWTLIAFVQVECVIPQLWNRILATITTKPITEKPVEFEFKGYKIHPTESYPYPTTPAGDKEFEKWEAEQEKLYAQEILAKLVSPNDTKLQYDTKALIANFLVNVAVENATGGEDYVSSEANITENQILENNSSVVENISKVQTEASNHLHYIPVNQDIEDEIESQEIPTGGLSAFNPIQSIIKAFSQNRSDSLIGNRSPLNSILNRLSPQRTTATLQYQTTPKNSISIQQKDLEKKVERLRENVSKRNITGVLDESLKIASLQTVSVLVNGLLNLFL